MNETTCMSCDKTFIYYANITFTSHKVDCLNGLAEHNWEFSYAIPNHMSDMYCTVCGEHRALTDEEREKYL